MQGGRTFSWHDQLSLTGAVTHHQPKSAVIHQPAVGQNGDLGNGKCNNGEMLNRMQCLVTVASNATDQPCHLTNTQCKNVMWVCVGSKTASTPWPHLGLDHHGRPFLAGLVLFKQVINATQSKRAVPGRVHPAALHKGGSGKRQQAQQPQRRQRRRQHQQADTIA